MDSGIRASIARLTPADFNWKELCEILDGFNLARDDKKANSELLDSMGYKVNQ